MMREPKTRFTRLEGFAQRPVAQPLEQLGYAYQGTQDGDPNAPGIQPPNAQVAEAVRCGPKHRDPRDRPD
jgi:hypothetical protein